MFNRGSLPNVGFVARRLLVWLLIGLAIWVTETPYSRPAEQSYNWLMGLIMWLLTVLIYETNAHWLFVQYLYTGRWLLFTGLSVILIALVDNLLVITYPLVQQIVHVPVTKVIPQATQPHLQIWTTIYRAGPIGWLTNAIVFGAIVGTPYFYASPFLIVQLFRQYLAQRQQTQQAELTNLALAHENTLPQLDLLKAQLNPHFLFNSLNSIYVRIIDANETAADLVLLLAELMRYNLYEADASSVSLDQELTYIANYLQLEQTRHDQRVEIIFSRAGEWPTLRIAPLILLAFVENAFKYGIGGTQQDTYVWIEAHIEPPSTFFFTVQNSLATVPHRSGSSITLEEFDLPKVRQRLAMLYPQAHQIETEHTHDSYSITLILELEPIEE